MKRWADIKESAGLPRENRAEPPEVADRATLALLDDQGEQLIEALVLNVLKRVELLKAPADLTESERATALQPFEALVHHYKLIFREMLRQAAALGETAVLEEMDRQGVERSIVDTAIDRRQRR